MDAEVKAFMWCVGLIFTSVNISIVFFGYKLSKRSEKRNSVLECLSLYYTQAVLNGTKRLWDLFEAHNHDVNKFLVGYNTIKTSEEGEEKNRRVMIPTANTLHYQRREVSHFWITLGVLLKNKLISKNIVFQLWSKDDVGIVTLLIYVENMLAEKHSKKKLHKNHPLCYMEKTKDKFFK